MPLLKSNLSSKFPILVAGPTGVGKSAFAVALAQRVGGEILCGDAFQVYSGLAVLTAQPRAEDTGGVPHHLYGTIDPEENFDAARFLRLADPVMRGIQQRGRHPILVGGTGLYLKSFTHGLDDLPPVDPSLRENLSRTPPEALRDLLRRYDPAAAETVDLQNPRRVQRALEIIITSGQPLSAHRQAWQGGPRFFYRAFLLQRPLPELEKRLRHNVEELLRQGAIEEVRRLRFLPATATARRAIGFASIEALLEEHLDRNACTEEIFRQTRQYAKRQRTWFARQKEYHPVLLQKNTSMEQIIATLPAELWQNDPA